MGMGCHSCSACRREEGLSCSSCSFQSAHSLTCFSSSKFVYLICCHKRSNSPVRFHNVSVQVASELPLSFKSGILDIITSFRPSSNCVNLWVIAGDGVGIMPMTLVLHVSRARLLRLNARNSPGKRKWEMTVFITFNPAWIGGDGLDHDLRWLD